jgi:hypothetical protein
LLKPFKDLDEAQTFPITVNFFVAHPYETFQALAQFWRKWLRDWLKANIPGATVKLLMDIAPTDISKIPHDYPADAISEALPTNSSGTHPAFLLHAHGFIHHPTMTRAELQKLLKKALAGFRRIAFSTPHPVVIDAQGYATGGLEGWAEYAAMEKTEVNYDCSLEGYSTESLSDPTTGPWDNVRVTSAMFIARQRWKRQARWITFTPAVDVHDKHGTQTTAVTRSLSDLRSSTWLKSHLDDLTGIDESFRDYSDGLDTPVVSKAKPVPSHEYHGHPQATYSGLFHYNCMVGCTLAIPHVFLDIAGLSTARVCSRPGIEKPP